VTARYPKYREYASTVSEYRAATLGLKNLEPTPSDITGPYYKDGTSFVHALCEHPTLAVEGSVLSTSGELLVDAVLDVWQADEFGVYDNEGYNFRGKFSTQGSVLIPPGNYRIETVQPGNYKISDPGEPDEFRCAHIHFKVSAPGFKVLTTQLYFPSDVHNKEDHWFDPRRVINTPKGFFNFVLEKE
jgi:protocatechuate 3,4-dioxygenase beta subunit